jgi:hydroxyacylglutathione hydrolase
MRSIVIPVPCLEDNYAYLVVGADGTTVVVDPSEPGPVLRALEEAGRPLSGIWATHHHFDHVGGIPGLLEAFPGIDVIGGRYDAEHGRIPHLTRAVGPEDELELDGERVRVLEVPGHTLGAITYVLGKDAFTGDTLFVAGCGRVFEGSMDMMAASMRALRALPDDTRVWCGHEYTVSNLAFARHEEPGNAYIAEAHAHAVARRAKGEPTVPGLLAEERKTNPFLRFDDPAAFGAALEPVASFTRLREAKNVFRAP